MSEALLPYIEDGYDVIALVPSCALMLKFEWPLILPEDAKVKTAVARRPTTSPNTWWRSPAAKAWRRA